VLYGQRILPVDGAIARTLGPAFQRRSAMTALNLIDRSHGTGGTYAVGDTQRSPFHPHRVQG